MSSVVLFTLALVCTSTRGAQRRDSPIPGWREMVFAGRTHYQQTPECVRAVSDSSASGLVRRVSVDLSQRPLLTWRWRASKMLSGTSADERQQAGDDFLARVYVIHEGLMPWQKQAINYVWTRQVPVGTHWTNPFAKQAVMVAVQRGSEGLGQWQSFRRDVRADFKRLHDQAVDEVQAVAVMTDTDNSGGQARACYQLPEFVAPD